MVSHTDKLKFLALLPLIIIMGFCLSADRVVTTVSVKSHYCGQTLPPGSGHRGVQWPGYCSSYVFHVREIGQDPPFLKSSHFSNFSKMGGLFRFLAQEKPLAAHPVKRGIFCFKKFSYEILHRGLTY